MGYYISLTDVNLHIESRNLAPALEALKALNGPEYNKHKVSDEENGPHYMWMSRDYDKCVNSVGDVLHLLDFEYDENDDGLTVYAFDSKWRNQIPLFLSALAPFVKVGSYLMFAGEDPFDIWKYTYEEDGLKESLATLSWTDPVTVAFDGPVW